MKKHEANFRFDNPNDIQYGWGRVVYEPAYEAWILPGSIRTRDRSYAEEVAKRIDDITRRQGGVRL